MARISRRKINRAHIDASKASSIGLPSLTAATTPVATDGNRPAQGTQQARDGGAAEAWSYYDVVGELSYVCRWLGNNLTQVRLMASA